MKKSNLFGMIEDKMIILAIETSCDDTCISVIKDFDILSNVVSSQIEIHKKYGGVFPALAKREHQKNLVPVLRQSLKIAKLLKQENQKLDEEELKDILAREQGLSKKLITFLKKYQKPKIDAIAVTVGPGLEPCLWAGINFSKALSHYWNLPVIPINHIEAHIFANLINTEIKFPAAALVVSGGHTQLILMKALGKYKILGETRDDAAGECFDKTARILGLSYPGGPEIAKMASEAKRQKNIKLPRPMIYSKNYDFSFSGLKTAVLYNFKKQTKISKKYIREMCAEIQQSIIDVLIRKTMRAAQEHKAKTIILGGGVTANKELKKQFQEKTKELKLEFLVPKTKFSTDNAAMIGITACHHWPKKKTKNWRNLKANANLRI